MVQCESCEHGRARTSHADTIFEHCVSCGTDWPEAAFQAKALQEWRAKKQLHLMVCAGCTVAKDSHIASTYHACERCERSLPLAARIGNGYTQPWGPITIRQFLDRNEAAVHWICYECSYPKCSNVNCGKRPQFTALERKDRKE